MSRSSPSVSRRTWQRSWPSSVSPPPFLSALGPDPTATPWRRQMIAFRPILPRRWALSRARAISEEDRAGEVVNEVIPRRKVGDSGRPARGARCDGALVFLGGMGVGTGRRGPVRRRSLRPNGDPIMPGRPVTDQQVRLYMQDRLRHSQRVAAARAGFSELHRAGREPPERALESRRRAARTPHRQALRRVSQP